MKVKVTMNSDEKKNSMQLENYFLALIETDHLKSLSKCLMMWYFSVIQKKDFFKKYDFCWEGRVEKILILYFL